MGLRVNFFQRKPVGGVNSVETVFDGVRQHLSKKIDSRTIVSPFASRGFWGRLFNCFHACWHQGEVNHVTGDVHFLTYFLKKKKTVLTILDCIMLERLVGFKRWVFWLLWLKLPSLRCSHITVISEATKSQLLKELSFDPDKVKVIYCGISSGFSPQPQAFNSNCPKILQVGTFENKNLERVFEALQGVSCTLSIIGRLSEKQKNLLVENQIRYENEYDLKREEVIEKYIESDMVIFASTYEGFGMPIIEAQSIGRPVITSNISSMPEIGGSGVCLVNPFDPMDIRAGILKTVENEDFRNDLISKGYENVKRFDIDLIASLYEELYLQLKD
jgi:glycosyltransferase involved in cell wall biosynthesis